ncbi:hypothetical protein [Halosolutus halophilus]|uniref:hypothetical protein n=1 Tax=Halosolutus halophilus TaxID=1552990 RepID=UPI0022352326|nr:hypothetical protein [Halosolutus halophilus]
MAESTNIVQKSFELQKKNSFPKDERDYAVVDFYPDEDRVVILGCLVNGNSLHQLSLEDLSLENELVMTGSSLYLYRLVVEFANGIPEVFEIEHYDVDGDQQYRVLEQHIPPDDPDRECGTRPS